MTPAEPFGRADAPRPAVTLASRRPGHAAMTQLLQQLTARHSGPGRPAAVPPDLVSWQVGAIGEQVVGQELALLPTGWQVLHAVPAGARGADIDHLVIGPAGVFVLSTKHHAARSVKVGTHVVWIDGHQQDGYQQELLRRRDQVATVLRGALGVVPPIHPVLVFVAPRILTAPGDQRVDALPSSSLVRHLTSLPPVLAPEAVRTLAQRAELPSTWSAPQTVLDEPDPTMAFLALPETPSVRTPRPSGPWAPRRAIRAQRPRAAHAVAATAAFGMSVVVASAAVAATVLALGTAAHAFVAP
jgi:hypothetical protein